MVDKENGGKADALNAGINAARYPLFCAIDADTLLEPDALRAAVLPFLRTPTTVAAGGIVRVVNGCTVEAGGSPRSRLPRNWLARSRSSSTCARSSSAASAGRRWTRC